MVYQNYLLIIDDMLLDEKLQAYFAEFGLQIVQKSWLPQMNKELNPPIALLINWAMIQADPTIIDAIYQQYTIPIIIISETSNEEVCVRMLEDFADDFIIKPINPRELHARISAITRRVQRATRPVNNEKEVLSFDKWRIYPTSRQLFDEQQEIPLSAKEYDLLLAFVRQPQQVLSQEFLSQITHCGDLHPLDRRVAVQICRLRQKIEADAKRPVLIKTIRNNGYLFTTNVISTSA